MEKPTQKRLETIKIICAAKHRTHYFQFADFETVCDLKKSLIKKYKYPDNIVISSKSHRLSDNEKILDNIKDETSKELTLSIPDNSCKV